MNMANMIQNPLLFHFAVKQVFAGVTPCTLTDYPSTPIESPILQHLLYLANTSCTGWSGCIRG